MENTYCNKFHSKIMCPNKRNILTHCCILIIVMYHKHYLHTIRRMLNFLLNNRIRLLNIYKQLVQIKLKINYHINYKVNTKSNLIDKDNSYRANNISQSHSSIQSYLCTYPFVFFVLCK